MKAKQTEWKRIELAVERMDFTGATESELENDGNQFLALTLKLKCGRVVRIRKNDYSVSLEEPVVPMQTKYLAKTSSGLERLFDTEDSAKEAIEGIDGEVTEVKVAVKQEPVQIPF